MSEDWRAFRKEANRGIRFGTGWILVGVVLVLVVGAAVWGISVATSEVRGQGDGVIERNSAENWLDAQARFEENYADYRSTLARIDLFYTEHQANPDDAVAKTNYLGSVAYCTELVADYNADARNFLREEFRASDLPDELDATSCEETVQ